MLKVYQVEPGLHIFGHIHQDYGQYAKDDNTFINASVLDDHYQLVHQPVVINLGMKGQHLHTVKGGEK